MANLSDASPSFLERAQDFVAENKRAILIGTAAAVVAVGGVAYYASTSRQRTDAQGPILEERKTTVQDAEVDVEKLSAEEIASKPEEERAQIATTFKQKGNNAYKSSNYSLAADYYTKAIQISPKPESTFYSNRAACYVNMSPPQHEKVVADCDEALRLDRTYVKALNRRGLAHENLGHYERALNDYTAATIFDKFQNQQTAASVERVLKKLSTEKAQEIFKGRPLRLPSHTFISAYFAAFRERPMPALPESPSQGDETLQLALQALKASDYPHVVSLVNEAIDQGISTTEGKAEALNVRGTFKFLMGDIDGAKGDLEESIKLVPGFTQSLVKIASVHMEQGDPRTAFDCFEQAIKHNPNDPDIYYHRGQVLFIMNEYGQAAENYTKSTELDDTFVFSHIQLAVAQYKSEKIANSMATFRRTIKTFPNRSEPHNYYGELLLDQNRFEDAIEKFDKAISLESSSPSNSSTPRKPNVLPLVNKGLASFQWKQDLSAAERCCNEALRIDDECEAAVATLAQLNLQQSRIGEAVKLFERQVELARSEPEIANALTYLYASKSQMEFMKAYPEMAEQLSQIARNMP
ncbi:Mitochondrial import receptor subunit tom-70 [Leucoagaricus sp. SymC.cos]|nr:Mitochondrial import receptor subunit tom-70 [Leucoagaricus sp. SymC.cos]